MTNPTLAAIHARRSIRAYQPEQISDEQLQTLLDAGEAAPSAVNSQPWHFTAVQNAALIDRVNEAFRAQVLKTCPPEARDRFADPAYSVFYHAPTVIFFSCPDLSKMKYAQTDTGMAIENMALAAESMGLGTVILGMPREAFAGDEKAALEEALQFPEGYEFCLALSVGVPAASKEAHPVLPGRVTVIR
jgi:nitroreductase